MSSKSDSDSTSFSKNWELNIYELNRIPHEIIYDETEIAVSPKILQNELMCPICLDILKNTMTTKECLHRFCHDCIITALRAGNKECPTCRKKLISKRSLRPDPNFDGIIAKIYPNREEYDALHEKVLEKLNKKHLTAISGANRESHKHNRHAAVAAAAAAAAANRSNANINSNNANVSNIQNSTMQQHNGLTPTSNTNNNTDHHSSNLNSSTTITTTSAMSTSNTTNNNINTNNDQHMDVQQHNNNEPSSNNTNQIDLATTPQHTNSNLEPISTILTNNNNNKSNESIHPNTNSNSNNNNAHRGNKRPIQSTHSDDSDLESRTSTEQSSLHLQNDLDEVELVLRPHPIKELTLSSKRFLKTTSNATINHLSKYLWTRLCVEAPSQSAPTTTTTTTTTNTSQNGQSTPPTSTSTSNLQQTLTTTSTTTNSTTANTTSTVATTTTNTTNSDNHHVHHNQQQQQQQSSSSSSSSSLLNSDNPITDFQIFISSNEKVANSFQFLNPNLTLEQVIDKHWKLNRPLELFYFLKPQSTTSLNIATSNTSGGGGGGVVAGGGGAAGGGGDLVNGNLLNTNNINSSSSTSNLTNGTNVVNFNGTIHS